MPPNITDMLPTQLTYNQAIETTEIKDGFFKKETVVDGYKVTMFNYLFPGYSSFIDNERKINLFEMRGLTFVHEETINEDSGETKVVHHRNLMLHKFFNINQTEHTLERNLTMPITHVSDKIDGSMIRFIMLPNGNIVAKSKMSFISTQAKMANKLLKEDEKLLSIVTFTLKNNIALMFEYTSNTNQIVIVYDKPRLTILQARNELTGEYLDIDQFNYPYKAEKFEPTPTLEQLISLASSETKVEGWVVRFNNTFVKIKTKWYINAHSIVINNQPHSIAKLVINETIDDLFSIITDNHYMFSVATEINDKLSKYIVKEFGTALVMAKDVTNENRKEYAKANRKHPLFSTVMVIVSKGEEFAFKAYKKNLLKYTKKNMWDKFASNQLGIKK